ncbi:TIR-only protein-like [Oryza glaberrima]|uniref:TIR domain-containing protein n=2 Tax=Oryza TaxID=4527 RepID=A0A0D3GSI6_9ORYZ|nr:TIR-only protein-like [Oryza glaberrima]
MSSTGLSRGRRCTIASRLNASAEAAVAATSSSRGEKQKAAVARRVEYYDEEDARGEARYDVFINHRGVDTKRTVARLFYDRLVAAGVRAFLDNQSMRPGDRLDERIGEAISQCGVAVAIFSPHYCDSEYCLRELALLVESRKKIIPVFYNIKPSDLVLPQAVVESVAHHPRDIERFKFALREVKNTVGLTYDPATGDLAELVTSAATAVLENIDKHEVTQGRQMIMSRL